MANYRGGRINEEIKKSASAIIQNKVKDPRISSMVSVTRVDVTRDLSYAKIYVSIFGSEEQNKSTLQALKSSEGFIRNEIGKMVKIRHVPQVIIVKDDSLEYGMNIESVLRKIKENGDNDNK